MIDDADQETLSLESVVVVAALVVLAYLFTATRVHENLQTVGCLVIFGMLAVHRRWLLSPIAWFCVGGVLLIALISRPLDVPNHHFMLTYLSTAIALSLTAGSYHQKTRVLGTNARWMVVVLMGFAGLQKLLQPTFLNGSYLSFELCRGSFAKPIMSFVDRYSSVVAQNEVLIARLRSSPPELLESVTLQSPVEHLELVAFWFLVSIIAIEVVMFLGMLFFPRKVATHYIIWSFALTLGVLRQEVTFLSVVCVLGLASCPEERRVLRLGYAVMAIVFAASVLKTINL